MFRKRKEIAKKRRRFVNLRNEVDVPISSPMHPGFYSFPLVKGASFVSMGVGYADCAALQLGLRGA